MPPYRAIVGRAGLGFGADAGGADGTYRNRSLKLAIGRSIQCQEREATTMVVTILTRSSQSGSPSWR